MRLTSRDAATSSTASGMGDPEAEAGVSIELPRPLLVGRVGLKVRVIGELLRPLLVGWVGPEFGVSCGHLGPLQEVSHGQAREGLARRSIVEGRSVEVSLIPKKP